LVNLSNHLNKPKLYKTLAFTLVKTVQFIPDV